MCVSRCALSHYTTWCDKSVTFSTEDDHQTQLATIARQSEQYGRPTAGVVRDDQSCASDSDPRQEDSLAVLFRRVHGRYAQYFNARSGKTGQLWQNRFFGCCLSVSHLWRALAYVDPFPFPRPFPEKPAEYRVIHCVVGR
jgi:hypothetical protein